MALAPALPTWIFYFLPGTPAAITCSFGYNISYDRLPGHPDFTCAAALPAGLNIIIIFGTFTAAFFTNII